MKQKTQKQCKKRGFTIVELLIVIVVIAILAAISIVAYNGIQARQMIVKYELQYHSLKRPFRYGRSITQMY